MAEIKTIPTTSQTLEAELSDIRRRIKDLRLREICLLHRNSQTLNYDNGLHCPRCDGNNLHQGAVSLIRKDFDDGVSIEFACEHCSDDFDYDLHLRIFQHKGTTYIEWTWKDEWTWTDAP